MSYDGSSAKSYIRHPTEKERLDNLAFASFPEDYLPYAAAPGHHRGSVPPPYLLWGEDRRRRPTSKRRKPKCAGALLCAIGLVVLAILAVVAISVYLGVVTNLFRSPVVSVSGRFTAAEDFSDELLNSSSQKFLEKADTFKSKVEKAFYSSSLEPAFIAARIYSFRPGLQVFFRIYLDRRKLPNEKESPPKELVRDLVAQKLTSDPDSVHVEENEELLSAELGVPDTGRRPSATTSTTSKPRKQQNGHQPPASGGVGEWRPIPIEDSVSPSFADRPLGPVRSSQETARGSSAAGLGSVRVLEESQPKIQQPSLGNPQEGVGSVRVLEESPARNPQLSKNSRDGTGRLEESRSPLLPALRRESASSVSGLGKSGRYPQLPPIQGEGIGTVRLLDESSPKAPVPPGNIGVGSAGFLGDNIQSAPKLSENQRQGVGSVRLTDETFQNSAQLSVNSRSGVGLASELDDNPTKKLSPFGNPSEGLGFVRPIEEPPTLAPSVSLVVRNRSRSDKPKHLPSRLAKIEHNSDLIENQGVGVGSIREVASEDDFPLLLPKEPSAIASRLLDLNPESTSVTNPPAENITEITTDEGKLESTKHDSFEISTEIFSTVKNELDTVILNATKELDSNAPETSKIENISETDFVTLKETTPVEVTTRPTQSLDLKISHLENILFNHSKSSLTTEADLNGPDVLTTIIQTESVTIKGNTREDEQDNESAEHNYSTIVTDMTPETEILEKETLPTFSTKSDEDIHSSIVNYSQYLFHEPQYHTIENKSNISSKEAFEAHTLEGHGFHKPSINTEAVTPLRVSSIHSTAQNPITSVMNSTQSPPIDKASEIKFRNNSANVSEVDTGFSEPSVDSSETSVNSSNNYETWSEEEEAANVTTDDTSQQAKIVPQMQSDFASNDLGDQESDDEENGHYEIEILRHITTLRPQLNGSDILTELCPLGSIPCDVRGEKCGVRCDLRRDCPNNEDEINCTCSDLLRAMGQSQKICDGVDDCSDGSDEAKCPWCPTSNYFICPGSRACVSLDQVCDGKDDCPGGQDEKRCVNLANSSSEAESFEYRSEGYLIVRKNGRWGKLCLDTLSESPDLNRRITDLGRAVCSALTYKNMSSSIRSSDSSETEDSYYQISTTVPSNRSSATASLFESTICKRKEVLKVQCKTLECGLRPSASSQRRRIVGGRSADGAGSWPWAAALYREGEFQCGAAVISDNWLISAAHCFYSSQHAYWSARLGVLRRGSELRSGGEQVRKIQHIVLHPEYEDVGFINDIALLRMDQPVPFSDSLRPICLPSSPKEDAALWHGQRCSVVGWGKLYEIGHTFPDSLQEVRLPVISSAECQRRSIFLPAYRITPKMFCAGYDRGGRDACLGDSGGPMACQRASDGRWILLGVTSNGDGCGRPGRPGVYSQVAGFLTWIQETISDQKEFNGTTSSESKCTGVRCRLGRCVQKNRICDGRRDCAGGEDEDGC